MAESGLILKAMNTVFDYLDYREYLRDVFEDRKTRAPWYSYKLFGDGVGLDQSQVYRILQKQLHLSAAALPRFVAYLGLEGPAVDYFAKLVEMGKTRKESEARKLFAALLELRGSQSRMLSGKQFGLYETWYLPVVRALLGIFEISDNYAVLASKLNPPISADKARQAVKRLAQLGLVFRDRDGIWRLEGKSWSTGKEFQSEAVRRYQAQTFRLCEESLERVPRELRDVNVVNMAADQQAFDDCVEILAEARRRIRERIEHVDSPDRILRLTSALVPVAGPFALEEAS